MVANDRKKRRRDVLQEARQMRAGPPRWWSMNTATSKKAWKTGIDLEVLHRGDVIEMRNSGALEVNEPFETKGTYARVGGIIIIAEPDCWH